MMSALFIAADLAIAVLVICVVSPEDRARLGRITRLGRAAR
jgi:hypothetical protein